MPNLETVTLPANLIGIPKDAFANSAKLATVNFKTADASNNQSARDGENAITLPTGITSIGQNAFQGTAATTVDLSAMTGLTTIENSVFKDMTSLAEVKLPSTVTRINQSAFQNDAALKKLSQKNPTVQTREDNADTTAKFGKSLTSIGQNAFYGTGFTTVDLSEAGTATSAGGSSSTQTSATPLSVDSGAFTNMVNLTTVTLPTNANINPAYFGNPATAGAEPKLQAITYGTGTATATITDTTISSPNFSKIKNQVIEIKSSVAGSTINFTGGVFNGNNTMTTLKLNVTATNGNNPL